MDIGSDIYELGQINFGQFCYRVHLSWIAFQHYWEFFLHLQDCFSLPKKF